MDQFVLSLLYLLLFRITVLLIGALCVVLGYKLFVNGIYGEKTTSDGTKIQAQFGDAKVNLSQVAPGTCFAVFGLALIVVMLLHGSPEVTLRKIQSSTSPVVENKSTPNDTLFEGLLKGIDKSVKGESLEAAMEYLGAGDTSSAVKAFHENAAASAPALNALAWLYLKNGETKRALPLSKTAVDLQPDNADYHHTLAEIYRESNETSLYTQHLKTAARLNPGKYGSKD